MTRVGGKPVARRRPRTERYRYRVGHTFSPNGLLVGKQDALEAALWAAIVATDERAHVSERLLRRLEGSTNPVLLQRYRDDIAETPAGSRSFEA